MRPGIQARWRESAQVIVPAGDPRTPPPRSRPAARPVLMSVFGPEEVWLVTLPGTPKTSRFRSRPQRAVIRVPKYSMASMTSTPTDMPRKMRPRTRKGGAKVPRGKFADQRITERRNLLRQARILLGKMTSTPVPNSAIVLPLAFAPRWLAVSTPRAIPLVMTRPCEAKSQASRSAIPEPHGVGCRVATSAKPGIVRWLLTR